MTGMSWDSEGTVENVCLFERKKALCVRLTSICYIYIFHFLQFGKFSKKGCFLHTPDA